MTISLSAFRALRAKMTQGEWELWTSNSQRRLTARNQQDGGVLSAVYHHRLGYADLAGNNRDRDLAGIVATHNAADTLLEIVEAALAANTAACDCGGDSGCSEGCSALRACRAFEAALARVVP